MRRGHRFKLGALEVRNIVYIAPVADLSQAFSQERLQPIGAAESRR